MQIFIEPHVKLDKYLNKTITIDCTIHDPFLINSQYIQWLKACELIGSLINIQWFPFELKGI